jgi:hypothetical protein
LPFDGSQMAVVEVNQDSAVTFNMDYGSASLVTFDLSAGSGAVLTFMQPTGTITARETTMDSSDGGTVSYSNFGGRQVVSGPSGAMSLGESAGSNLNYLLSNAGSVQAGNLYVGKGGTGSVNQMSGNVGVTTDLYMGYAAGASGRYVLGTGNLVADGEWVGFDGTGVLQQTGGMNWSNGAVTVAAHAGSTGTYKMSGGTLRAQQLVVDSGGSFQQSGGSVQVSSVQVNGGWNQSGGMLSAGTLTGGNMTLSGTASVSAALAQLGSLTITGGATFDIGNGTLVLNQAAAQVRDYIAGGKLVSSVPDPAGVHGIGYEVGDGSVTARYTLIGDANLDGVIDAEDYAALDAGAAVGTGLWANGDFNDDGVVDRADYLAIDRSLLWQGGGMSAGLLADRTEEFGSDYVTELMDGVVPEPSMMGLIGIGALMSHRRRR